MAEIKIRELSVGDWVRYEFPEIGKRNIQVNSIDEEDNHIGAGGVGASAWSDVSKFEPIPLTPDVLEKNGWKEIVRNIKYQTWAQGDTYILKYSAEERYCLFMRSYEMKFSLYHTHQLQHALRLAGVEKEIEV